VKGLAWVGPLVVALAVLVVAWSGRASEGRRALVEAEGALARGDTFDAILAARVAAEARCPGCAAPTAGFAKLEAIAKAAEAKGDDATAFASWRAARAAALATGAPRDRADQEIARFGHRLDVAAMASGANATAAASEERLRAALTLGGVPGSATYALMAAGGALFALGALRFVRHGRRLPELGLALVGAALAAVGTLLF
jgi:hypothetical protein